MADRRTERDRGRERRWGDDLGQADRGHGGGYAAIGYGRGYGRDFGAGGRNQGFDGSWGAGYGGSVAPSDYREGFGGEAYGGGMAADDYARSFGGRGGDFGADDGSWIDREADRRAAPQEEGRHAGRGPKGWTRSDARVREAVCEQMMDDRLLDAREIEVSVSGGTVRLSGHVPHPSDVRLAEMIARSAVGRIEVRNDLEVAPGASAGGGGDEDAERDPKARFRPRGQEHALTSGERLQALGRPGPDDRG